MLVLRLQRTGRKNIPAYRLVVTEKNAPIKGGVKEFIGHYLPARNPHVFEYKKDRIEHWIKNGAQPTDTVARLLKREGIENMDGFIKRYAKQKKRKPDAPAAEEAKPQEEEKPTEEPKEEGGDTEEKKE